MQGAEFLVLSQLLLPLPPVARGHTTAYTQTKELDSDSTLSSARSCAVYFTAV